MLQAVPAVQRSNFHDSAGAAKRVATASGSAQIGRLNPKSMEASPVHWRIPRATGFSGVGCPLTPAESGGSFARAVRAAHGLPNGYSGEIGKLNGSWPHRGDRGARGRRDP